MLNDAILVGATRMRLQGFNPRIVVLSETAYNFLALYKAGDGSYLAPNYQSLPLAFGGMRIALSAGVAAGKALLIDPSYCGFLGSGTVRVSIGYTGDQFKKNLVTLRGETTIIPFFGDYQGALLVTPAAS